MCTCARTRSHARIHRAELTKEFTRIGITESAAFSLWKYHDTDGNDELDFIEFHDMIVHILGNVHATFSAADIVALGRLMNEYDEDASGTLDFAEFKDLANDLVEANYRFTGREGPDTLELNQLYILREYNWKRRKMEKLEEGDEGPNNKQDQIDAMKEKFDVEKQQPVEGGEEPKKPEPEPMYVITKAQKKQLEHTCTLVKTVCRTCFPNSEMSERAGKLEHDSKDLPLLLMDVKQRIHTEVQRELNQRGDEQGFESLFDHTKDEDATYAMYIEVERVEGALRDIVLEHVRDIAAKLHKEGVIAVPTLEWDGALGREEEVAIERLGFLLNA